MGYHDHELKCNAWDTEEYYADHSEKQNSSILDIGKDTLYHSACIIYDKNQKMLMIGNDVGFIKAYDIESMSQIRHYGQVHNSELKSFALSESGKFLFAGFANGDIYRMCPGEPTNPIKFSKFCNFIPDRSKMNNCERHEAKAAEVIICI